MKKERWLLGFVAVLAILAVLLFALNLVTERGRDAAVNKLNAKTEMLRQRLFPSTAPSQQTPAQGDSASSPSAPGTPGGSSAPGMDDDAGRGDGAAMHSGRGQAASASGASGTDEAPEEDLSAVLARLLEKEISFYSHPRWKVAWDLIHDQNYGEWSQSDLELLAAFFEENRDFILDVRRLANASDPFYTLDYSMGHEMNLMHLARIRMFARALGADAVLAANRGDYGEMMSNLDAIARFSEMTRQDPIVVSQLVSMAVSGIAHTVVERALWGGDLPPAVAAQIMRRFPAFPNDSVFADSLTVEGLFGLEGFAGVRSGEVERTGLVMQGMEGYMLRLYGTMLARPFLNLDEATYADYLTRISDTLQRPYYEIHSVIEQLNTEIAQLPRTRILSREYLQFLVFMPEIQAMHEAQMGLMQTGLAIEQYHAQHGEYPQTLDPIASALGGTIPLDPFTGRPFVYKPQGGNYTLYCDMSSLMNLSGRQNQLPVDEHGYYVWRGWRDRDKKWIA